jgi:hypothetical protein
MKAFLWPKSYLEERLIWLDSSWMMKSFRLMAFIAQNWNTTKPSICLEIPVEICMFEFSAKSLDWWNRLFRWRRIWPHSFVHDPVIN